jgi:hypothetical protein
MFRKGMGTKPLAGLYSQYLDLGGGAVANVTAVLRIISLAKGLIHSVGCGEPASIYGETSYVEAGSKSSAV